MQQTLHLGRLLTVVEVLEAASLVAGVLLQVGDQASVLDAIEQQALAGGDHRNLAVAAAEGNELGRLRGRRQGGQLADALIACGRRGDRGCGVLHRGGTWHAMLPWTGR